jgi:hypothetical protein
MLKSEVGVCNFSTELSIFDVNTHLFMWNKLCQWGKMIEITSYVKISWNLLKKKKNKK